MFVHDITLFAAREVVSIEALKDRVKITVIPEGYCSSWAQYTIPVKEEEEGYALQQKLKEQGIPNMVYYPKPMHGQTVFMYLKHFVHCTESQKLCKIILSLPLDNNIARKSIKEIRRHVVLINRV